ncbi:MAG TPA: LytTR family DNA-binding domain-containing protein [Lachnospiraceae bacterium]|nr:LytTR family DNA-binding domain-containing protein [Lachnospiraceae bacterium]
MGSLRITIEELQGEEEEEVIIKCRKMTPELLRIISRLKAQDALIAYDGNEIHRVRPSDIFYIEAVDSRTFFYLKGRVYESKQKLYQLEEVLMGCDFLRISKSVIVNLSRIRSLSPALSGRFEATLDNGEKVIISRQYVGDLKKCLGI